MVRWGKVKKQTTFSRGQLDQGKEKQQLKTFVWLDPSYYKGILVVAAYNIEQAKTLVRQKKIDFVTDEDLSKPPLVLEEPQVVALWGVY